LSTTVYDDTVKRNVVIIWSSTRLFPVICFRDDSRTQTKHHTLLVM